MRKNQGNLRQQGMKAQGVAGPSRWCIGGGGGGKSMPVQLSGGGGLSEGATANVVFQSCSQRQVILREKLKGNN